jgi:hypothetical protein
MFGKDTVDVPAHSHDLTTDVFQFSGNASSFLANQNNSVVAGFPYVPGHSNTAMDEVNRGRARLLRVQATGVSDVTNAQPSLVVRYIIKL